jgi:hypothetical protein
MPQAAESAAPVKKEVILNVLCDDCFYERDISLSMDGPARVVGSAPLVRTVMTVYQCNCSRLYNSTLGYFTFVEGKGTSNIRKLAKCNSGDEKPMYLTEVLEDGRLKLKCPTCDYERVVLNNTTP